ncbi:MAG TPA: hypothetical protein PKY12_16470, partial [Catalimonadaceae bacterium]|nr:hypothetical protein [Catalimonadaceae bacterium]
MSKTYPPRGSLRCILDLVQKPNFLPIINGLLVNTGTAISSNDIRFPKGYHQKAEKELYEFLEIIGEVGLAQQVKNWWLEVHTANTRTPNWDLISTLKTTDGQPGILLVEAKAHHGELESSGKSIILYAPENSTIKVASENSIRNHNKIKAAIEEANTDISIQIPTSQISIDCCYQLSNRVAHAWWLANKGYPVVLMYLGFMECKDMPGRRLFIQNTDWPTCFDKKMNQVGLTGMASKKYHFGRGSL